MFETLHPPKSLKLPLFLSAGLQEKSAEISKEVDDKADTSL